MGRDEPCRARAHGLSGRVARVCDAPFGLPGGSAGDRELAAAGARPVSVVGCGKRITHRAAPPKFGTVFTQSRKERKERTSAFSLFLCVLCVENVGALRCAYGTLHFLA